MNVAIVLYDRFTALDAIGPYEVLSRVPGCTLTFLGAEVGPVRTDNGLLTVQVEASIAEVSAPDIVLVPGGPGEVAARAGGPLLQWLREAHETSTWTASVCTGSLILAAAGLLEGRRATSHWLALDELGRLGATPVSERVVFDGRIVTAAGVSAGIDMALATRSRPLTRARRRRRRMRSWRSCASAAACACRARTPWAPPAERLARASHAPRSRRAGPVADAGARGRRPITCVHGRGAL